MVDLQGRTNGAGFLIMIYYIYNQNILFKIIVDFTWRVSDCEELVELDQETKY